jgi:hypothetical protein
MANLVRDISLGTRIVGTALAAAAVRFCGGTGSPRLLQLVERFDRLDEKWFQHHKYVPSPESGCCGCGADIADLLIELDPADPRLSDCPFGETYCWVCYDGGQVGLSATDTMSVFPGHGARRTQVSA